MKMTLAPLNMTGYLCRSCATDGIRMSEVLDLWSEWQDLNLRPPRPERGEKLATTTSHRGSRRITPRRDH